jgi:cystathionine beta-lyase
MFLLCNPHNPTGRVFDSEELERMAAACVDHDILICSDEIHCDLVYPARNHIPIASLSHEVEARTITLMAPSKTFNLPGLKFSIAVIPNEDLRTQFVAARDELVRASNILGYTAAFAAYRDGDEWLTALLKYLQANREFLAGYLREHLPAIRFAPPEGTYLAWLDCRALPVENPAVFLRETGRVALNDGATFGPEGEGFARLSFACPRSMLVDGLDRMRRAFGQLPG